MQRVAGIAQWLECWTHDWKVMGLNPCRSSGIIFFSSVNFLCWLLFQYLFHPRVTAVASKRSQSLCQKCRWQVTAKHASTLHMWLCMKWHGIRLCGVHRTCWEGSSFMWHQPCQHCKYNTLVHTYSSRITSKHRESAWEWRIVLYKNSQRAEKVHVQWLGNML